MNAAKKEDPTEYNTKPELDSDIIDTQAHEKLAETKFMVAAPKKEKTLLQSDPICDSSGCNQYKFPEQAKKDEHPMDYPVPNFGRDGDVIGTYNSLDVAENMRRHRWNLSAEDLKKKDDDPVKYNGDPNLDDDIIGTQDHLATAEKTLGKWEWVQLDEDEESPEYNALQLKELMRQHQSSKQKWVNPVYNDPIALARMTSDPIFGTLDTPLDEHKFALGGRKIVEYPDPDQDGLDEDIKWTQKNLIDSQDFWGHTWKYNFSANMPNFGIPGKPNYIGEPKTDANLAKSTFTPSEMPEGNGHKNNKIIAKQWIKLPVEKEEDIKVVAAADPPKASTSEVANPLPPSKAAPTVQAQTTGAPAAPIAAPANSTTTTPPARVEVKGLLEE